MTSINRELTALVNNIREFPEDNLARLVAADWFEENGQPDRAEYIRLAVYAAENPKCLEIQAREEAGYMGISTDIECGRCLPCKHFRQLDVIEAPERNAKRAQWSLAIAGSRLAEWDRGFIVSTQTTVVRWTDAWCPTCQGSGVAPRVEPGQTPVPDVCPECGDEAHRKLPRGVRLVRREPVASVRLDKRPAETGPGLGTYGWYDKLADATSWSHMPFHVFHYLSGYKTETRTTNGRCRLYDSEADALADLGRAAVAWATDWKLDSLL